MKRKYELVKCQFTNATRKDIKSKWVILIYDCYGVFIKKKYMQDYKEAREYIKYLKFKDTAK
jgi:hypothetical protein